MQTTTQTGDQCTTGVRQPVQDADRIVVSPEEAARLLKINKALLRNEVIRDQSLWHRAPNYCEAMTTMQL